jgi:methenyltetrahydromethanopterin cyclohydrolase
MSLPKPETKVQKSSLSKQVVIIAHSGRMLANSARQSNWLPLVIDRFGDQEIAHLAQKNWVVPDLSKASLEPVIATIKQYFDVDQLVYGSGFEFHLETLFWLSEHFTVLGNASVTFQQVQDKVFFFATLQRLQIPFLETHFTAPPVGTDEWLVKPTSGEGGAGIHWYDSQESVADTVYWQRYQKGTVGSVLFVSDGESVQIIGFNGQWVESGQTQYPFVFSGVRHCPLVRVAYGQQVLDWLNQLVGAFSLVGLNSLDFIMNKGQLWVLEINPRPSASLMLYDGYCHNKLFERHVQGCMGHLIDIPAPATDYHRGYQVLYAYYELVIPEQVEWPDWVLDKPGAGVIIPINSPICSIIAAEKNTERLTYLLNHRARVVYQLLIYKEKISSCNFMPVLIN